MENSIEEDIARITKLITTRFNNDYSIDNKDKEAIEHILSDYRRVLKEIEVLKNQEATARKINELLVQRYSNSISKQKIKDKIREINKMIAYEHNDAVIIQLGKQNRVLQKLLESEE